MKTKLKTSTPKQLAARRLASLLRRRTKKFNALTRAEQRVAIAQDVLAALRAKQINPATQTWVEVAERVFIANPVGADLQPILEVEKCTACAVGACFVAAVRLGDDCVMPQSDGSRWFANLDEERLDSTGEGGYPGNMTTVLRRYFTVDQLRKIEYTFEGSYGNVGREDMARAGHAWLEASYEFWFAHRSDESRMIAIMENIVKNKGTFRLKYANQTH